MILPFFLLQVLRRYSIRVYVLEFGLLFFDNKGFKLVCHFCKGRSPFKILVVKVFFIELTLFSKRKLKLVKLFVNFKM